MGQFIIPVIIAKQRHLSIQAGEYHRQVCLIKITVAARISVAMDAVEILVAAVNKIHNRKREQTIIKTVIAERVGDGGGGHFFAPCGVLNPARGRQHQIRIHIQPHFQHINPQPQRKQMFIKIQRIKILAGDGDTARTGNLINIKIIVQKPAAPGIGTEFKSQ